MGWIDLMASTIHGDLEEFAQLPKIKGVRHPIHDEPDSNFVRRAGFNRGVDMLRDWKLSFDLLIFEDHLPQAIPFVDPHPNQIFVLDHIAKPRIGSACRHTSVDLFSMGEHHPLCDRRPHARRGRLDSLAIGNSSI